MIDEFMFKWWWAVCAGLGVIALILSAVFLL